MPLGAVVCRGMASRAASQCMVAGLRVGSCWPLPHCVNADVSAGQRGSFDANPARKPSRSFHADC
jgi:hypothetical protein